MDHFDVMALMMPDLSQRLRDGFAGIMRQVARDEREACAKIAEGVISRDEDWDSSYWNQCACRIAMKIRERNG